MSSMVFGGLRDLEVLSEGMSRPGLRYLETQYPELHKLLYHSMQFRQKSAASEYHV